MERLKCKACSSYGMVPMKVQVKGEDVTLPGGKQESLFYTCHVCGDNWLSIKETAAYGESRIIFIHQMGISPLLKRVASLEEDQATARQDVGHWSYFLGDDEISEGQWKEKLEDRRRMLKSICTN